MHVRKLPSGSWNVMAYAGRDADGKNIVKSFTGPDLRTLKSEAALWEADRKVSRLSFAAAADRFMSARKNVISPSTLRSYHAIRGSLSEYRSFWRAPLHSITTAQLQNMIAQMDVSPKTIKNRVGFISAVMKFEGYAMPEVRLPQVPVPDLKIPEKATVEKTLAAADGELWICIMLAAVGPLRAGEICGLDLDDINGDIVHVHRSLVRGPDNAWTLKPPKTFTSDRYVVMPHALVERIHQQGFVTKMNPNQLHHAFSRLLEKNGIPHYRFHDLRHFAISEMLLAGVEEIYIAERSGHKDYATLKRYTHALAAHREDVTARIFDRLNFV